MTGVLSRSYSGARDLQRVLDLLAAVTPADPIASYPSIVDLYELHDLSRVRANTRLWIGPPDRFVAFVLVELHRVAQAAGFRTTSTSLWFARPVP